MHRIVSLLVAVMVMSFATLTQANTSPGKTQLYAFSNLTLPQIGRTDSLSLNYLRVGTRIYFGNPSDRNGQWMTRLEYNFAIDDVYRAYVEGKWSDLAFGLPLDMQVGRFLAPIGWFYPDPAKIEQSRYPVALNDHKTNLDGVWLSTEIFGFNIGGGYFTKNGDQLITTVQWQWLKLYYESGVAYGLTTDSAIEGHSWWFHPYGGIDILDARNKSVRSFVTNYFDLTDRWRLYAQVDYVNGYPGVEATEQVHGQFYPSGSLVWRPIPDHLRFSLSYDDWQKTAIGKVSFNWEYLVRH